MIQSVVGTHMDQFRLNHHHLFFVKSITINVDMIFNLSCWTSLVSPLFIFVDLRKSHWSSVILLVQRSSASYSDPSSRNQKSMLTCIQRIDFWIKCLIIDNSLYLWESFGHRSRFLFLDTSISCMSLCPLQSLLRLDRPFMAYCNVSGNIN